MTETPLATRRAFDGRLLKLDVVEVRLDTGVTATREVVRHSGAIAATVRRPDGRLVFVRQYRLPAAEALLEVVAGGLNPGEDPAACARREIAEETGYRVRRLHPLGFVFSAPGYCDERLHLFHAEVDLEPSAAAPEEDERVEPVLLTAAEFEDLVRGDGIRDAKTLAVWLRARMAELL